MFIKRNHTGKLLAILPLMCAIAAQAASQDPLFLTATNGIANYLAIINTRTKEMDFVPTGGAGGASGNAGGVAVEGTLAAVVNFGSTNVTIFVREGNKMQPMQVIKKK
jgi:hypothetical protein